MIPRMRSRISSGFMRWAARWCKAIYSAARWAWRKRRSGCAARCGQSRRAKRRTCAVWSSGAGYGIAAAAAAPGTLSVLTRDVLLDPLRECLQELAHELAGVVADDRARIAEHLGGAANVSLGLRHGRNVEENQRLAKMVIGAEGADDARREAENRPWLAVPRALAVRPRCDVDRVFEHAGHRAVVLRRHEQHRVGLLDAALEVFSLLRRIGIEVLVVMRHLPDFDDLELQRRRCQPDHRLGHLAIEGFLAEAADDDRYITGGAHDAPFAGTDDRALGGAHGGIIGDRRPPQRTRRGTLCDGDGPSGFAKVQSTAAAEFSL